MTLLHWACDRGSVKMVEFLIKHQVSINQQVALYELLDGVNNTALLGL